MTPGSTVLACRKKAQLPLRTCALALEIHYTTLSRYERGLHPIPLKVAKRMAALFAKPAKAFCPDLANV